MAFVLYVADILINSLLIFAMGIIQAKTCTLVVDGAICKNVPALKFAVGKAKAEEFYSTNLRPSIQTIA